MLKELVRHPIRSIVMIAGRIRVFSKGLPRTRPGVDRKYGAETGKVVGNNNANSLNIQSDQPHVSVCIVGYRNKQDIQRCLGALQNSTHSAFEVVICENGGRAAFAHLTAEIDQRLPGGQAVTIFAAPFNLGYAGGVNACLAASPDADAWWVLNPDTEPDAHAMAALLNRLRRGDCDAVGSVIYFPDGAVESVGGSWGRWLARPQSIAHGARSADEIDPAIIEPDLSYLSGASAMVGRRFLREIGPMREDYFLYCEEVEWFLRGRQAGMRLGVAPDARVMHLQGTTTGSVRNLRERSRAAVYLDTRNRILVTRDRYATSLPLAIPAVIAIMALRCVRRGAWPQFGYALAGWWAGVRNERGAPAWLEP